MKRLLNIILVYSLALFFLSIITVKALYLSGAIDDTDLLGRHGVIAMWITIILGLAFGVGLGGLFFYLAHQQSRDEKKRKRQKERLQTQDTSNETTSENAKEKEQNISSP